MRIFVYEFITGGGLFAADGRVPRGSLLAEGTAMLQALAADLCLANGFDVELLWDGRLKSNHPPAARVTSVDDVASHGHAFARACRESDGVVLIAPELNGVLTAAACRVEHLGGRLLSPDARFIALASDKGRVAAAWERSRIPTPATQICRNPAEFEAGGIRRWIVKPNDGAGSQGIQLVDASDVSLRLGPGQTLCVQPFHEGRPASVAALCGGAEPCWLPACWQDLAPPDFRYRGGSAIDDPKLAARARNLASAALDALPATRGYVGIDLLLGTAEDGSEDVAIEVNPRLTTSYVGLRHLVRPNLAESMVAIAQGRSVALSCERRPVQFGASGTVWAGDLET